MNPTIHNNYPLYQALKDATQDEVIELLEKAKVDVTTTDVEDKKHGCLISTCFNILFKQVKTNLEPILSKKNSTRIITVPGYKGYVTFSKLLDLVQNVNSASIEAMHKMDKYFYFTQTHDEEPIIEWNPKNNFYGDGPRLDCLQIEDSFKPMMAPPSVMENLTEMPRSAYPALTERKESSIRATLNYYKAVDIHLERLFLESKPQIEGTPQVEKFQRRRLDRDFEILNNMTTARKIRDVANNAIAEFLKSQK